MQQKKYCTIAGCPIIFLYYCCVGAHNFITWWSLFFILIHVSCQTSGMCLCALAKATLHFPFSCFYVDVSKKIYTMELTNSFFFIELNTWDKQCLLSNKTYKTLLGNTNSRKWLDLTKLSFPMSKSSPTQHLKSMKMGNEFTPESKHKLTWPQMWSKGLRPSSSRFRA